MFAFLKGWLGERATQFGLWMGLDAKVYRRLHDLVLPCQGGTTQIDHVLLSAYGIFVIETKNMRGWIFGSERSAEWTQSIYGKKTRFQNPLRQNYRHLKALAEFLEVPDQILHPVVVFVGDCEFKTPMPENVLRFGLSRYVESFRERVLSEQEVDQLLDRLRRAKAAPVASHSLHVRGLKARHGGQSCPKCGSALVLRTARTGANAGGSFLGCSGFPKCRYTRAA